MVRDEVVGVLDCQSDLPAFFDNETVDLLTLFATQASIGLQNAKLYSMLQRRAAQLEAINAIAKRTTVELDLKELLDRLCNQLPQSFQVEHVAIFLRDEDGDLILRAQQGTLSSRSRWVTACPTAMPAPRASGRRSPYCGDPSQCPAGCFPAGREEVCLPLVSFGENIGLLVCATTQRKTHSSPMTFRRWNPWLTFWPPPPRTPATSTGFASLHIVTDSPGVFNRRYFDSRLVDEVTRAARYGGGVSVLMIDLDHFKKINDEFGHMLGDDVLRAVSALFLRQLRKVDVVCRYGGEEFAVVLPATQGASAAAVAEKLRRAVANTEFAGVPYPVTVSIGVAEFPVHGITRDDIVRAADARALRCQGSRTQPGLPCLRRRLGFGDGPDIRSPAFDNRPSAHLTLVIEVTISVTSPRFPRLMNMMSLRSHLRFHTALQLSLALESAEETLVGGQAVLEGVMMRAPHAWGIAIRKPDGELAIHSEPLARPATRAPGRHGLSSAALSPSAPPWSLVSRLCAIRPMSLWKTRRPPAEKSLR